jgi:16S rRNA (cytosine1402-N4)-methyltransferase
MVDEVVECLEVRSGGRYVDATLGEAGHAVRLLEASSPDGRLLGVDWDGDALASSKRRLDRFGTRVTLVRGSFADLRAILEDAGWGAGADGVLLDLGVSTLQLGTAERGFSFAADGPLDMRMDSRVPRAAAVLVNELSEGELAELLVGYGEERAARRIARAIVRHRARARIETTRDLREVVVAAGVHGRPGHDPATRTFQALRIAVNRELEQLARFLDEGWLTLRPGGRLAVLTYHSLEDRMVKQAFRCWSASCLCPPRQPVCTCGWHARTRLLTPRKRKPSAAEIDRNPRARSAGLRAVERLAERADASVSGRELPS